MIEIDTIVIGGGQAGLAAGYHLKEKRIDFLILDSQKRVGDTWRNRYDSLTLFTPVAYNHLPGLALPGNANHFPTKSEVADYLENYAAYFKMPIHMNICVTSIEKQDEDFYLKTDQETYVCKKVIIATGVFQKPKIPGFSSLLGGEIHQIHASEYKNEKQIATGSVLVVGGGNSGAQIAKELSKSHQVYWSVSKKPQLIPLTVLSKSVFWWLDKLKLLHVEQNTTRGKWMKRHFNPILVTEMKKMIKDKKIIIKSEAIIASAVSVLFSDGSDLTPKTIIWATGYQRDFTWLQIPDVFTENKKIRHLKGVTEVRGLYFLGMPWQSNRTSSLLGGVGVDAAYIVEKI
jgi:putative flavoprotein involved in K+ transport